ncbi:hypothetical protein EVAR_8315_1 [Eumeta japonica]|uniref:Uncharacterized protein n=1 Tax=Eumeta variegata TaxID=151549 RepID=A0A4C1VDW0_EUMVA|nr:hypothetical protein EVAR_8315_1 [Eumeta japonica]
MSRAANGSSKPGFTALKRQKSENSFRVGWPAIGSAPDWFPFVKRPRAPYAAARPPARAGTRHGSKPILRCKRVCEPPEDRRSPPSMDTRNLREVTCALPPFKRNRLSDGGGTSDLPRHRTGNTNYLQPDNFRWMDRSVM